MGGFMNKELDSILLRIENAVEKEEYDKALSLIEENVANLFSSATSSLLLFCWEISQKTGL